MIDINSLSLDWLLDRQQKYKRDPLLIESMIYALYLLEQLKLTGLPFIFKGGTSLILILNQPQRFSVDIDIIVSPEISREQLEEHLSKIVASGAFASMRLDERRSYKAGIPKAHYAFTFKSNFANKNRDGNVIANPEKEILLDVLFAENHYPNLLERPLQTEWLVLSGDPITITTPDINSITGDKLTAFAPNTTGVPYHRESVNAAGETFRSEMFMEIMKQTFDVGTLFDSLDDFAAFKKSYGATVLGEIKYRPERNIESVEAVLRDTIATALLIARHDAQINDEDKEKYTYLKTGMDRFRHFVYTIVFRPEHAQVASAKAAYLAATILSGHDGPLKRFSDQIPLADYLITHPDYNFLNKRLKFVAKGEALFYWNEIVKLLYTDKT